ncbi:MAG TPA: hypothetical protein VL326_22990 [Kofleriaceae bacterium]|jgi:hypothetical protein|nr:hypothetical protein [Kofleriaceae bacterium]
MTTSALIARYVLRYRGALLGGIGSAAAVAVTMDPASSIAHSSVKFALSFAVIATLLAVLLTATIEILEKFAAPTVLPKAIARRRASRVRATAD